MAWAKKHEQCVKCEETTFPHVGRGLCEACYRSDNELRHKFHISRKRKSRRDDAPIRFEDLRREYIDEEMSLSDLARRYNCTRQYIHKLLKYHGVEGRDPRTARNLAISRGKVSVSRFDKDGNETRVILQKITRNQKFFKTWSSKMAYVLGVIFTDGNLLLGSERDSDYKARGSRLSIAQKEPELLEKVLALMECSAIIYRGKQVLTGNSICQFNIASDELYDDLLKLGVTPKKSRTMQFPQVPEPYVRHFIRGCWDGDGSVYLERGRLPRASYVTGSRQFAEEMIRQLASLGLPSVTLYSHQSRNSFYFRFGTVSACTRLYHLFYDDVPAVMYLSRKFERFKAIAFEHEGAYANKVTLPLPQLLEPVKPIPVQSDEWGAQRSSSRVAHQLEHPKTVGVRSGGRFGHKGKLLYAIPEPFTRTGLSQLLRISPRQVERILQAPELATRLQKLSQITIVSGKEFKESVRALKSEVKKFLYGWDDHGWDDLD